MWGLEVGATTHTVCEAVSLLGHKRHNSQHILQSKGSFEATRKIVRLFSWFPNARNGQLVYRICYGSEKTMPAEIRQLVKRNYYDQTITWVYQVNQNNRTIWVINVEDAKDLVMLRVEEMELEETQRIAKWK